MTPIQLAKETVCSSLLHKVDIYESMMQKTKDINELTKLHKTKNTNLFRLELMCR